MLGSSLLFQNLFCPIQCFVGHKKGGKGILLGKELCEDEKKPYICGILTPDLLFFYAKTQFPCERLEENSISVSTTTSKYREHQKMMFDQSLKSNKLDLMLSTALEVLRHCGLSANHDKDL